MPAPPLRTVITAVLLGALLVGTWSNAADRSQSDERAAPLAERARPGRRAAAAPLRPAPSAHALGGAPSAAPPADPLGAPRCPGVTLTTVSDLGDPDASRATLRSADDASPRARRFRGSVGGRRVVYVGDHPRTGAPTVWLTDGRGLCQVPLGPAPAIVASAPGAGRADRPAPGVARWVEPVDDATFRVDRRLVEAALGGGEALAPSLRGVDGRLGAEGFTLSRVPPGSLPARLGLLAGDRIVALGGRPLSGLEGIAQAQVELARSSRVTVTVLRGGVRRDLVYDVR